MSKVAPTSMARTPQEFTIGTPATDQGREMDWEAVDTRQTQIQADRQITEEVEDKEQNYELKANEQLTREASEQQGARNGGKEKDYAIRSLLEEKGYMQGPGSDSSSGAPTVVFRPPARRASSNRSQSAPPREAAEGTVRKEDKGVDRRWYEDTEDIRGLLEEQEHKIDRAIMTMKAAAEENRRGLEAAVDVLRQRLDTHGTTGLETAVHRIVTSIATSREETESCR